MTSKSTEIVPDQDRSGSSGAHVDGLTPGAVLDQGRYRLLAQVGWDARCNAQLWRARDGVLGRDVALTILVGDRADAEAAANARRTLERAMHASTFNHVGVARVLDVVTQSSGDPAGVLGIVIAEWTHGTDLLDLVAEGPLPPGTAARLLQPLAAAVEAAHHAGLILGADHPQRIRVTPDDEIRMAFPGPIASATSSDDVRGLGAVLYLLLTGRWALEGGPEGATPAPIGQDGSVVPPRTLRPTVPMELSTVAVRALGHPDFTGALGGVRTGAAVLRVLEQHASHENNSAPGADNNAVWRREDPKPDKVTRKKLMISVGVLVMATLLVVGWLGANLIGMFTASRQIPEDGVVVDDTASGQPSQPTGPPVDVAITSASPFNTNGSPDNPNSLRYLYDGDPSTDWSSSRYKQQLGPGGISDGTGAVLTFDKAVPLQEVVINSPSAGATVEIRTVDGTPSLDSGTVLGTATLQSGETTIPLQTGEPVDRILVVITQLVPEGGGYSAQINEIEVVGAATS